MYRLGLSVVVKIKPKSWTEHLRDDIGILIDELWKFKWVFCVSKYHRMIFANIEW